MYQISPGLIGDITAERIRQDAKWGGSAHDDGHNESDWNFIIGIINDEAYDSLATPLERRKKLVEVAALAVAAVEALDRAAE